MNIVACASNLRDVIVPLNDVRELFLRGSLPHERVPLDKRPALKAEFVKNHFSRFTEFILSSTVVTFYNAFNEEQKEQLVDVFFLYGPSRDSLVVLGSALSKETNLSNSKVVISLLERFCSLGRFVDLFVNQSQVDDLKNGPVIIGQSHIEHLLRDKVITFVVSLPQRVANKMKLECSSQFHPDPYFHMLALQIVDTLEKLHENLTMSQDCSFKFLSELLGRICMAGQVDRVFAILLPALENWLVTSPLWRRICVQLITGVPDANMERVAEQLLKRAGNSTVISKLFGDLVVTNLKLQYLFTTKFLLMRFYPNINIVHNIIGYLSGCKKRDMLIDTVFTLLDVWGDKSAIQHTGYDQHFYITCATVLSFGHMSTEEKSVHKHTLLTKLLVGVHCHLDNPVEKVRRLGMVVAECLTLTLEPSVDKIEFEYDDNKETKLLKSLAKGLRESKDVVKGNGKVCMKSDARLEEEAKQQGGVRANSELLFPGEEPCQTELQEGSDISEEENDDGLIPYVLDEETDTDCKSPKHLRNCIEGLVACEDPVKREASLEVVQKLVCAMPNDLKEVCVELVKVLLHLQDNSSTERFCELRHGALVSVTVRCPKQIACYLTEEFYAPNYNFQQRMDILNILADATLQLSDPKEISMEKPIPRKFSSLPSNSFIPHHSIPEWQRIVQERINAKTKRLSKGSSHPPAKIVANKFAAVAGFFFFPLMKNFDHKVNTLDLLNDDNLIFGKLISTLGIMMYSARNTTIARNMGTALLEFAWCWRYHKEAFVRQALIFAQAMVVVSVPSSVLMSDAANELFELHDWLKETAQSEVDEECAKASVRTLLLVEEVLKNQVA